MTAVYEEADPTYENKFQCLRKVGPEFLGRTLVDGACLRSEELPGQPEDHDGWAKVARHLAESIALGGGTVAADARTLRTDSSDAFLPAADHGSCLHVIWDQPLALGSRRRTMPLPRSRTPSVARPCDR
ncbi:hypothetical protein HPB47_005747 [Ixodes persulcatus]|uniref:Uncharacterized protein n=1 Tax=Ixodes persulcatus TaxID=34615 RepID=A0AC60PDB7_IXOPE|nr:hypothetical protein HPB47_005747 [Ixodes persulcatus]